MKRISVLLTIVGLVALLALGQSKPDEKPVQQSSDAMMSCPMMGMMKQMPPEMMERMQLLMRTPIFLDSPCPLYAQAEKLNLSEDQKKKLVEIENEARQKARAVLTSEQRTKLGNVPDKPVTMMETCPMMKSGTK